MEKLCLRIKIFDNASIHETAGNIIVPQLSEISFNIFGCFFGIFSHKGNIQYQHNWSKMQYAEWIKEMPLF